MAAADPTCFVDPPAPRQNSRLILVSGPARRESRWAEHLLHHHPVVTYIATAAARPMTLTGRGVLTRIGSVDPTTGASESAGELINTINDLDQVQSVLIDSLGGFVASHLDHSPKDWNLLCARLITTIKSSECTFVMVIEETGWGVVPPTRIGGLFRDRLGTLAQELDRVADAAWLVVQGRALDLHALGQVVP